MNIIPYLDRILQFSLVMGRMLGGAGICPDSGFQMHSPTMLGSSNQLGISMMQQTRTLQTDAQSLW